MSHLSRTDKDEIMRLAALGAHLGVWSWNEVTGEVVWDATTREMFGVRGDAPITVDTFYAYLHPDDRERTRQTWRDALERRMPYQIDYRSQRRDGSVRWIHARGRGYYDEAGRPLRMIGVVFDITEHKQAELQLQVWREDIAHRNRISLMGEMTASLAHELNQPLTAIANNASAARRFLERGEIDTELLQQLLGDVVADSKRASEVIRGVRSLVRKDTAVQHALLNLNAIIADTVRLVNSDVLTRESVLTTEFDPQLPQVNAAPVHIQQVLLNLIMNALDAVDQLPPAARRIVITTRSDKGEAAEVSVRDYGMGLPKDSPGKIFDHFFSTKQTGMGMGLTIVRSIIESLGGTIAAENAPDRGARFFFRLPAALRPLGALTTL
jgi:two-component system, LuxR family, sensor kinase FixL